MNYSFLRIIMAFKYQSDAIPDLRMTNIPKEIFIGATKLLKSFVKVFLKATKKAIHVTCN